MGLFGVPLQHILHHLAVLAALGNCGSSGLDDLVDALGEKRGRLHGGDHRSTIHCVAEQSDVPRAPVDIERGVDHARCNQPVPVGLHLPGLVLGIARGVSEMSRPGRQHALLQAVASEQVGRIKIGVGHLRITPRVAELFPGGSNAVDMESIEVRDLGPGFVGFAAEGVVDGARCPGHERSLGSELARVGAVELHVGHPTRGGHLSNPAALQLVHVGAERELPGGARRDAAVSQRSSSTLAAIDRGRRGATGTAGAARCTSGGTGR